MRRFAFAAEGGRRARNEVDSQGRENLLVLFCANAKGLAGGEKCRGGLILLGFAALLLERGGRGDEKSFRNPLALEGENML